MRLTVAVGNLLDEQADALICSANPWLALSGGVGGAILQRGGDSVQAELKAHLKQLGKPIVAQGGVVRTGPGPLAVRHLLHVVGVNAFYESSPEVVAAALDRALTEAAALDCRTVATCAIATGFGPLTMEQFGRALRQVASRAFPPIEQLTLVVRREEEAEEVRRGMAAQA